MEQYIPQAEAARTPPSHPESERGVLGAMLRSREAALLAVENLRPEDFYDPANIYVLGRDKRSFREFVNCPPEPVDPEIRDNYLLSNWLKRFD